MTPPGELNQDTQPKVRYNFSYRKQTTGDWVESQTKLKRKFTFSK